MWAALHNFSHWNGKWRRCTAACFLVDNIGQHLPNYKRGSLSNESAGIVSGKEYTREQWVRQKLQAFLWRFVKSWEFVRDLQEAIFSKHWLDYGKMTVLPLSDVMWQTRVFSTCVKSFQEALQWMFEMSAGLFALEQLRSLSSICHHNGRGFFHCSVPLRLFLRGFHYFDAFATASGNPSPAFLLGGLDIQLQLSAVSNQYRKKTLWMRKKRFHCSFEKYAPFPFT